MLDSTTRLINSIHELCDKPMLFLRHHWLFVALTTLVLTYIRDIRKRKELERLTRPLPITAIVQGRR